MSKLQLVLFVDNELHKEFDKNLCEMGDLHNAVKEEKIQEELTRRQKAADELKETSPEFESWSLM